MNLSNVPFPELIDSLKNKRKDYDGLVEEQTRALVINPILLALGWDTTQSADVTVEAKAGKDEVDYHLHFGDSKVWLVEAKRVDDDALADARTQLFNYAWGIGAGMGVITNGYEWDFYLPLAQTAEDRRLFEVVDLIGQSTEDVVTRLTKYLSKEKLISGEAIHEAELQLPNFVPYKELEPLVREEWNKLIDEQNEEIINVLFRRIQTDKNFHFITVNYLKDYFSKNKHLIKIEAGLTDTSEIKPLKNISTLDNRELVAIHINTSASTSVEKVNSDKEAIEKLLTYILQHGATDTKDKLKSLTEVPFPVFSLSQSDEFPDSVVSNNLYLKSPLNLNQTLRTLKNIAKVFGYLDNIKIEFFKKA